LWAKKKHTLAIYFFVVTFGVVFYVFLDFLFTGSEGGAVMLLWPFSSQLFYGFISYSSTLAADLDALLLLSWRLYHEERKHKILDHTRFYIKFICFYKIYAENINILKTSHKSVKS
jgi:hypothetical protein